MENSHEKYSALLSQPDDGFMIDTTGDPEIKAAIREALAAPKPITGASKLAKLLGVGPIASRRGSFSSAGLGPFNDEDDDDDNLNTQENETRDSTEFKHYSDIGIFMETQELQPWKRSSPSADWAEELDEAPETPCP
ncbi:hypothetical protein B0J13DRAFT_534298 [Dactylonectria estremocensis]|uniref:Uncharacterized protein n=1 Tax=Dactylonectria estremocensis TaxID=1079267 RepID=A0A9P9I9P3_9HYPO|nr:hypothetical protein B0J13DRAFT_534298 [Dactylonectria estremocensis]